MNILEELKKVKDELKITDELKDVGELVEKLEELMKNLKDLKGNDFIEKEKGY